MEVMRDYAKSEVGLIPADWFVAELGELITYIKGFPFKSSEYRNAGIRIIRVSDTTYDAIKEIDPIYVSERSASNYVTWRLRENDLIVSTVGSKPPMYDSMVGKVIMIDRTHKNSLLNQNAVLIRDRQLRDYFQVLLLNHLRTKKYVLHIESIYRGNANQASITLKELFQFRIPLPVVELEQRAIAKALLEVDELLNSIDRLIAKKRDLKQAAMQQLLTGQTRLPGFSGEWANTKISQMCEYVDGVRTFGGDVGYLEIGDIDVELKSYRISSKDKLSVAGAVKVPVGTLLISTVRPTRGAIAITQSSLHVSSAFCRLKPVNDFLYHVVCQTVFLRHLGENAIGGTYPTCRDETILDYETLMPCDKGEQVAIASILSDMDAELASIEVQREKTRDLKQAVMQELLTGRTRLV